MQATGQLNDDERPTFWAELEARIDQKGMTKSQFAWELGISPQGLSSWKERNQIRRQCLPQISSLLDWPEITETCLQKTYKVKVINGRPSTPQNIEPNKFLAVLRKSNRSYRSHEKYYKQYAKQSLQVLDALGENGFFAFSSCTTSPYEFEPSPEGNTIATAIAKAIDRGVLCLYIRPTNLGVQYYTKEWGYGRVVEHSEAVKEMEGFRDRVKRDLVRGVGKQKYSSAKAEAAVYERMDQCYVKTSPMWMPGVGLSMMGQFHARELNARMAITLPGGKFGGLLIYPQYYALEFRFARFLRKVVLDACEQLAQPDEERPIQLLVSDQHRKSLGIFYNRYSQILRTVSSIVPPDSALR